MIKNILFIIFIIFSNQAFSEKIAIVSSEFSNQVINLYVSKISNRYDIRIFYILNNNSASDLYELLHDFNPDMTLLVGDEIISLYRLRETNKKVIYCCNFRKDPFSLKFQTTVKGGVYYLIDYGKLKELINDFNQVYLLKSNEEYSNIVSDLILENLKNIKIEVVLITNIKELRKFFVSIKKNSVILNFLSYIDSNYDNQFINEEISIWNKNTIDIGRSNSTILLMPDYESVVSKLIIITENKDYKTLNFEEKLNVVLNFKKLNNTKFYFNNFQFFDILENYDE